MEVLMSVGSRVIYFGGRHESWRLVHHHRVGGVTTSAAWAWIGAAFGNLSMDTILSCGVPSMLNIIWETTYKLKTVGAASSQELSVKDGKGYKEIMPIGGLIPHKNLLCLIEGPSMFARLRRTRRDLGAKELGQACDQSEQVMSRMNNYVTRPSALSFLTSIPEKIPWAALRASVSIHKVSPSAKAVPVD